MKCPGCGVEGPRDDVIEERFETRGQYQGKNVRRCRSCGAGFFAAWFRPRLVPAPLWAQMQQRWDEQFGAADDPPSPDAEQTVKMGLFRRKRADHESAPVSAEAIVADLKRAYPNANITIRNDPLCISVLVNLTAVEAEFNREVAPMVRANEETEKCGEDPLPFQQPDINAKLEAAFNNPANWTPRLEEKWTRFDLDPTTGKLEGDLVAEFLPKGVDQEVFRKEETY